MDKEVKTQRAERPKRVPLYKSKALEFKQRDGFIRRLVNEKPGNIDRYLAAGWTPVVGDEDISDNRAQKESKLGSVVRRVVNHASDASSHTAILMEIPVEFYKEDQIAKQNMIDEREKTFDPSKFKNQTGADYGEFKQTRS